MLVYDSNETLKYNANHKSLPFIDQKAKDQVSVRRNEKLNSSFIISNNLEKIEEQKQSQEFSAFNKEEQDLIKASELLPTGFSYAID